MSRFLKTIAALATACSVASCNAGGTSSNVPSGAANDAPTQQNGGQTFWQKTGKTLHLCPIKSGNNGSCSPTYFCTDGTHEYKSYGGPTGWGTPHGLGQF